MQYIWAALELLLNNINNYGKWAKPDLSDLKNDLLNNSIKSIS